MNILVTGLCLQGNKGGPAIALALKEQLKRYFSEANFIFSVPSGDEFKYEMSWANRYGVEIIENYSLSDLLPPFIFKNPISKYRRVKRWFKKLSEVDLVIDMSGISYVGHPIGSVNSVLFSTRFIYFLSALLKKKPFLAWTQSYGPLSNRIIRFLAKFDLERQPVVFCRGDDCLAEVNHLLPQKKAFSFPDVAAVLTYDHEWGSRYINSLLKNINVEKLITLSPSAVIFNMTRENIEVNKHVEEMFKFCGFLLEKDYFVLLVPHTLRPNRPNPKICDHAVSQLVFDQLKDDPNIAIIHEDLSPVELKSIISAAYVHVGARYHSIIASLSSGVPTIALSWHPKYKDIMRMYGCEKYVYRNTDNSKISELIVLCEEVCRQRSEIHNKLILAQEAIKSKVEENTRLFVSIVNTIL